MNVVLVSHCNLDNSAIQVYSVAHELVNLGVNCAVCVPGPASQINYSGVPQFSVVSYPDAYAQGVAFSNGEGPDLIHAWTPRELVREITEYLAARYSCRYVVHLEDNEETILENEAGIAYEELVELPPDELEALVPASRSHPIRYKEFLAGAAAVTALIDRLLEFKPEHLPGVVFWPGFDSQFLELPSDSAAGLRSRLGIQDGSTVIVYNGNIHQTNAREVRSLFLAVQALRRMRRRVVLIKAGSHQESHEWIREAVDAGAVIDLGFLPRREIYTLLAAADVLVQPGRSDPFNDYRFPSKLPEFFASGKPVILPRTNLGRFVRDGCEALVLESGSAIEIAQKIEMLMDDPDLATRIRAAGREFAKKYLAWSANVPLLTQCYADVLSREDLSSRRAAPNDASRETGGGAQLHADPVNGSKSAGMNNSHTGYRVEPLSYGTVRDYCDSVDSLPMLATASGDLKDCQRPWTVKAIASQLPGKGRLLEIGAGEPLVADVLQRLGYEVWIVDPYDGSGNGPTAYEQYVKRYPDLRFVRAEFSDQLDGVEEGAFDGIYSISVLEHISGEALNRVFAGLRRFLNPHGWSIHAIDHVHRGNGATEHLANLRRMMGGFGIEQDDLSSLLRAIDKDTDTYYLSAEGHNRWRGTIPYDTFPMRVCVSIQVVIDALRLRAPRGELRV